MEFLKTALESIIEEFQMLSQMDSKKLADKYAKRIEISRNLGENGWVISCRATPNDQREWVNKIERYGEEVILSYFSDHEIDEMLHQIKAKYKTLPEVQYLKWAIENYMSKRYTEAAIFLLALLDYRISCITPKEIRKKNKQCKELLTCTQQKIFDGTQNRIGTQVIFVADLMPSFTAFAERVFIDGKYGFEKGIEPPYLNRNWLMYGRMTRRVERYECVQVINALNTLIDIEEELKNLD